MEMLYAGGATPETGSSGGSGGSGATIEVLNKTGAVINAGDKVWLSENTQVGGVSSTLDPFTLSNATSLGFMDRTGNFLAADKNMYDITNENMTLLGATPNQYYNNLYYGDDDSVIFDNNSTVYRADSKKQLKTYGAYFLGGSFVAKNSKYSADGGGYYYEVSKIDMTTGLTIRSWKISVQPTKQSFVVNDYYFKFDSTKLYYWNISDDVDSEEVQSYSTSNLLNMNKTGSFYPLGVTADKKYLITSMGTYPYGMAYLIMYEFVSETQIRQLSMSEMPADLQEFYGISGCYTFNPYTGVLTAVASNGTSYAVVKYENGEWTKIPVDLPVFDKNFYGPMTISDDLSRAMVVCKTTSSSTSTAGYIVNLTTLDGYSAIPYKPYTINEQSLVGYAMTDAEPNETVTVSVPAEV